MKLPKINLPLLIISLGIIFSLYLLSRVPEDIYFSGDAGLKALLAKQFSSGKLNFDLDLSVPSWVRNLWDNGLYPFEPPFSYKISNRYYITFPFTFPLITAPFHALFGYRGFYIVPLLSTWIIWFNFYRICQFFKISVLTTSIGITTLIFASPLTMYSAMYWEHTLAVSLAFAGLVIILSKGEEGFTQKDALVSGILIGLSVWFRPEFLALVAILIPLALSSYKIKLGKISIINQHKILFIISLLATVSCFFIINKLIYNHPLGAHALQVVEEFSLQERLSKAHRIFGRLWKNFREYFPIVYFTIIFTGLSVFYKSIKLTAAMKKIVLISIPFIFLVPILLPSDGGKQWGPRFLLILIPLLSLLAAFLLESTLSIRQFGIKYISTGIFTALFMIGVYANTFMGINYSYFTGNTEAIDIRNFLRQDDHKIVAVAHQYISQSFEAAFKNKLFFLTKNLDDTSKLGLALNEQGYDNFVYVCASYDPCFSSPTIPSQINISATDKLLRVQLKEVKKNKKYIIQEAEIVQVKDN
ncbi:conserved hypothetical protein [Trichormus variabilis ATCC 29413]|uniref:Glycosyltransferase RgtA/B/C/D-like domain-containing protein n=4 Tax=Nostocaceae TaxID=1162 RepID=Q3MF36_TRIV2|nr:conserved hypothetical protein [Trichormus variabilis ATCC 29413]MBC1212622.1 hypothetical protein [Trichormus variabilis ARAD]MBC1254413.1 hypothetical protein [Trichormus variabilis V5]MBC1300534.1 hypothetical protein [Trichormus variabilis N2B]MBC1309524.1 hypothetical protein [Trichormus variabilis PNB]MBC1324767.1 hypothetical protein [Trichormus variabilis 9RC]MBD2379177.1 hypothetical protein [Trichormus variabilis FACHB-319]QFZ15759.1 hypothetical protein EH233_04435 [Anabaena sp